MWRHRCILLQYLNFYSEAADTVRLLLGKDPFQCVAYNDVKRKHFYLFMKEEMFL